MKLGVVGPNMPDTFADNIVASLIRMGHEAYNIGTITPRTSSRIITRASELRRQAFSAVEANAHQKIAAKGLELECDAVINTEGGLAPSAVKLLKANKVPSALWFPDCVANLGRQRMLEAPYTALFFKDRLLVERIRNMLDLPVSHLPEACNPEWHKPIGEAGTKPYIVVAGNTYLTRLLLLERLHKAGIPLVIYGAPIPRWAPNVIPPALHQRRSVYREEKAKTFREAAGVLNNLHPAEMTGVNARLFEAAGCGAAVLCEQRAELGELFDLEREVVPFTNFDELVDKCRLLLQEPGMTKVIGDAAYKRAHSQHTYEDRLVKICDKLSH